VKPAPSVASAQRLARTGRARPRDFLTNWPLLAGLAVVLALLVMVLFGPVLAPENPYLAGQRSVTIEDGRVQAPPLPPAPDPPLGTDQWGRDILSMLLYGARNTLVACVFIATARVLLGWSLGAVAAWHEGALIDRLILSAIEFTSSLPMLLAGVMLILALDIRRGILVFMVALSLVGWGEIAQYVRAEFLVVRRRPFIEGARVIGLDGWGIAIRHVLPNVLPALTVLAMLEIGAVLMILGELGFVGIYIGGGTAIEGLSGFRQAAIPTIPEWGAMMADSRLWARSQPWMVFFPALAFFVAVLGFNLLGEGLRRLIQRGGVNTSFVFSRKMLVVLAVIVTSTAYIVTHVGPAPSYTNLAQRFDEERAMAHVEALAGARALGSAEADAAASYIAARLQEYGLQPFNSAEGYFQRVPLQMVEPVRQPELALLAHDGAVARAYRHRVDFAEDILRHAGSGAVTAPLTYVGFRGSPSGREFRGLDLRDRVVMYDPAAAPTGFDVEALIRGAQGLLLVDDDVRPRLQLAYEAQDYLRPPTIPTFHITRDAADSMLAGADLSLERLTGAVQQEPPASGWQQTDLPVQVRLTLELSPVREVTAQNVLGILPGTDVLLDEELVVVSAHYDGSQDPDGTVFAGAASSASPVAVMLDILRLWHEQGFRPRRTMVFAAWAGGMLERGGVYRYVEATRYSPLRSVAAIYLYGLGRGGSALTVSSASAELTDLIQRSGEALGVEVRMGDGPHLPGLPAFTGRCPSVALSWEGADDVAAPDDTLAGVDAAKLSQAGQMVNLALITLGREASY
jgi:ABC-type dipeptide/oligopeptide/nickel transport system permease subunit